ncbi:13493_t:CDS:2 [Entrophospora sp. SA101]|nr:13493_t:CDS:2 [Entrophospora sp. SA101]
MSTPSSFAQPTVWAIEQMENPLILNHHPSSAFGLPSMSETFKDEEKCKKKLHNMLGKYLGTVFQEIDGKLVFVVESKGNCTIVKFSRRYPKDIHLKCSELGLTPKLITINNLEGADCIKSAVEKTVNRFHNAGFVHGNMHANNIFGYLNCSKIHIKIVGLSWAGYEGKARYPFFLKKDKIQRDEGATDGNLITKEHDRYLINQIFTKKH